MAQPASSEPANQPQGPLVGADAIDAYFTDKEAAQKAGNATKFKGRLVLIEVEQKGTSKKVQLQYVKEGVSSGQGFLAQFGVGNASLKKIAQYLAKNEREVFENGNREDTKDKVGELLGRYKSSVFGLKIDEATKKVFPPPLKKLEKEELQELSTAVQNFLTENLNKPIGGRVSKRWAGRYEYMPGYTSEVVHAFMSQINKLGNQGKSETFKTLTSNIKTQNEETLQVT